MLAPKQHRNSGHKPIQQKQKKKPFKLKREGLNATPEVRAKLKIGSPNDKFEKEADSVADTVVNKKENPNIQQAPAPPVQTMKVTSTDLQRMSEAEEDVQAKEDEEVQLQSESESEVQMMEMGTEEEPNVQMKSSESETEVQMMSEMGTEEEPNVQMMSEESDVQTMSTETDSKVQMMSEMGTEEDSNVQMMPSESDSEVQMESESESDVQTKLKKNKKQKDISSDLKSSKGGGQKMDADTQSTMEDGFGTDLSGVNIHTDSKSIKMNEEIGSKAFTNGADIYFNEGQYQPESKEGQTLLAHELTHTMQQGAVETGKQSKKEKRAAKKAEKAEKKAEKQEARQEKKEARQEARAESQAAKTEAKIEKAEIKAETKEAKKAEKAKKKEEKKKAKEEKKEEKKKPNPKEDPNFQAVMGNIKKEAHKQKPKDDPTQLGDSANEAAESPASEAGSLAMADQVEEMEKEEPKVFSAETFKEMLSERIESMQLPKNNEEADEFEDHNNIDEVNKAATKDVQNETASTTANIDQKTNEEPKVKPDHKREPEKLKTAKKGKKPKSVDAKKAIPPVRKPSEIEKPLADDTARLDNRMAEDNVTDNQLAISQEPKFENALDEKNKAKEESAANASTLRAQESGVRKNNAATAEAASKEELKGMQALNHSAVKKVTAGQNKTSDKDTAERDRVAGEINAIYDNTQKDVNKILEDLDKKVEKDFAVASKKARAAFEAYVGYKFYKYKRRRYSGIKGPFRWTRDLFMGLPDEVNRYFEEGRELFIEIMDAEIDKIAVHIANELNRATQRIEDGKQEVTDYVENLPKDLKKFGKEAAEEIQDKFDELSEDVNSKQDDLVDMLAEEYVAALNEVDERIEEMKAANRGLVDMVMDFIDGVLETIRKLKEMIQNLLSAIMSVIDVIMADPIGFMGMLFDGLAEGFENFKNNIQKHLLGGLLEWLTGSLGPMGITVPEDIFSLSGVFDLTLQVLGLGWDYIKLKAVRMMGQPMVDVLMTGFDMFKTFATEGAMGIWKYVKDKFQDLKATVIDAIKEMLITKVIEAGVKWLLSLLIPGAGFIKAIMAIKDIIVFFVESAIMLIPAITEAILALAKGDIKGVAKAMEFGLAKLITLVISLFAKLIGLGGLTKRVQKIFKKIRKRVDKAISKLLRKARKAGRKLMRKLGLGKKKKKKGKDEKDPKKQAKIDKGIKFLNKEEKKYMEDGKISREGAEKAAASTKKNNKVFTSFKVVDGEDTWDYEYKASPPTTLQGEKKDDEKTVKGELMNSSNVTSKSDLNITEKREGQKLVGYKAKSSESKKKYDGFIVGQSENSYIRARKQRGDHKEEFKTLQGLKTQKERYEHIKGSGADQPLEEKMEIYQSVLKKAGVKLKEPKELTKNSVDQFRRDMIVKVAAAYPKKLDSLDKDILHGSLTGTVSNKILGEIFEKWVDLNVKDVGGVEIVFNNGGVIRRADAQAKGSLVEMKSISSGPNPEHLSQMAFYAEVISSGQKGYLAGSKGEKKAGPFSSIRYYFSNENAARQWEPKLKATFGSKVKIYAGHKLLKAPKKKT